MIRLFKGNYVFKKKSHKALMETNKAIVVLNKEKKDVMELLFDTKKHVRCSAILMSCSTWLFFNDAGTLAGLIGFEEFNDHLMLICEKKNLQLQQHS
ncbi:hypothetical protein L1887_05583 [Cichorium endivia]|nr:hypothetical protein L1887_05583 [Cichorium endivia]